MYHVLITSHYARDRSFFYCTFMSIHIQVLDQYFKRASDSIRTNFVLTKGFNLLAAQLKQFKVSVQLISALVSMALGQEVNLSKEQLVPSLLSVCAFLIF